MNFSIRCFLFLARTRDCAFAARPQKRKWHLTSSLPYFSSEPLKARFTQDIREALGASRIDSAAAQWLRRLVDADQAHLPAPRIERVSIGDALPQDAELAGAWILSNPLTPDSAVYLSTLLLGIEAFNNRAALVACLRKRFRQISSSLLEIDEALVEGAVFDQRMHVILEHQVWSLDSYSEQLHGMPTLQTAACRALQDTINQALPGATIDVSQQLVQICSTIASPSLAPASSVMGTQTLADAAFQNCSGEPLIQGLEHRFMDARGRALDATAAAPYVRALGEVAAALPESYRRELANYWTASLDDGRSRQEAMAQALAQAFRHQLLKSRANGSLSEFEYRRMRSLLASPEAAEAGHVIHCYRLTVETIAETEADTAGLVIIEFHGAQLPGLYLFSASSGFTRIANRLQLNAHFATPQARTSLLQHVALADRVRVPAAGAALRIRLHPMAASPFAAQVALIFQFQAQNLAHVLSLPAMGSQKTPVRIDDALDIRQLLDSRLVAGQGSWRWQSQVIDFHSFWNAPDNIDRTARVDIGDPVDTWAIRVQKLDALVDRLARLHPGAQMRMQRELNRYLLLLELPALDVEALQVLLRPTDPRAMPPWALAFGRVSGASNRLITSEAVIQQLSASGTVVSVSGLPAVLLDWVVARAAASFAAGLERQLRHFHSRPIRSGAIQLCPEYISGWVREEALRLQLAVGLNLGKIEASSLAMLQQVLDRPEPALRQALGDEQVDVYRIGLACEAFRAPLRLPTAFVLTSPQWPQRHVVWIPGRGLRVFASLSALRDKLNAAVTQVGYNTQFVNILAAPDRMTLLAYLASSDAPAIDVALQRIDGHFIHALQADAAERSIQSAQWTFFNSKTWQLLPEVFCNASTASERDDYLRPMLNHLALTIEAIVDSSIIPLWLSNASVADQEKMLSAMRRFVVSCAVDKSFLFGIPAIYDFCRQALQRKLETEFPDEHLDAELIEVTLTHYVPMPASTGQVPSWVAATTSKATENLVEFAINRFAALQDGIITLTATDGRTLPATLDSRYISKLVSSLDIAASYMAIVDKALNEDSADHAERRELFAQQIPALDCMRSLEYRLRQKLTDQALNMVQAILEMPDGIARLPVDGLAVGISPLLLCPGDGWASNAVMGVYLIAPQTSQAGPWIMYSPWDEKMVFREYSDQAALLADIRTSASLQESLLAGIDPGSRGIYAHGGFQEPHLRFSTEASFDVPFTRPPAVTVKFEPLRGNALETLFKGALDIFRLRIRLASVTSAEENRASINYLLGLGAEQVLALAPGRLGALVGIWQSRELLSSTATALRNQRWGKALSEFMAALGVMISSRQVLEGDAAMSEDLLAESADAEALPDFSWSNHAMTPRLRNRLRSLQAQNVALSTLRSDDQYNTYVDEHTGQHYAAIGGAVYPVTSTSLGWFVGTEQHKGPAIRLNDEQQWVFKFDHGLKGGGAILTRVKTGLIQAEVEDHMMVRATGMEDIRRLNRDHAQCIEEAHAQARFYLENCLANLDLHDQHGIFDARVAQLVGDFFVEHVPDAQLYASIRQTVSRIYDGLTDPSLSPHDSPRFVVGLTRLGSEARMTAFTVPSDPFKRVFLTERFFRPPVYRLKTRVVRAGSFDMGAHYRAAILLHELSHLTLATEDITYVDAEAPYVDLLEDSSGYRLRVKNEQIAQQQRGLSYNTDRTQLFKLLESDTWRDLKRSDSAAKGMILRITGRAKLEEARDVFYASKEKRRQIMLSNADSVALMVTLLGRERFTASSR